MASVPPTDNGVTPPTGVPGNDGQVAVLAPEVTPAPVAVPAPPQAPEVTAEDLAQEFGEGDVPATDGQPPAAEPEAGGEEGAGAPEEPPVRQQTAEERIAELTAKAREAERRAEAAEAEAARLRPPEETATAPAEDAEPDPANYEFGEADTQFIKDSAAHAARQAIREEMLLQANHQRVTAEVARLEATRDERYVEGRAKYSDFEEKVIQGADNGAWPCPPAVAIALIRSPVGHDMAYHLANNVAEAQRIAELPPIEQGYELGMLAARFSSSTQPVVPPKQTSAPAPPRHLARGDEGRFATPLDSDDFKAVEARMDAMMAGKR